MTEIERSIRYLIHFTKRIRTDYINQENMESFIYKIFKANINFVIDVRNNTYFKKDFRPEHLGKILKKNDIRYKHMKSLGNPYHKEMLNALKKAKTPDDKRNLSLKAKKRFLHYLNKRMMIKDNGEKILPHHAISSLYQIINAKFPELKFTLICYCNTQDFLKCHRFWIKEILIKQKRKELGMSYKNYKLEV